MRKIVAFLVVLCSASVAHAQVVAPSMQTRRFGTAVGGATKAAKVLSAVALNAAAGSRTFTMATLGMSKLSVQVNLTYNAATDLQLTCKVSLDDGTTYADMSSTSVSSGTGTVSAYHDVRSTGGASINALFEYDVRTYDYVKCVVSGTSGGASDYVTAYAIAAVGQ